MEVKNFNTGRIFVMFFIMLFVGIGNGSKFLINVKRYKKDERNEIGKFLFYVCSIVKWGFMQSLKILFTVIEMYWCYGNGIEFYLLLKDDNIFRVNISVKMLIDFFDRV